MTLPVTAGKTNDTASFDDHPSHHNDLATAVNDDLLRAALSPTTPNRVFGTTFQPSATRPAWVSYTIKFTTVTDAVTTESSEVELRSDAANPPVTVRAVVMSGRSVTVNSMTTTSKKQLSYLVPAGHRVRLAVIGDEGNAEIVNQVEIIL